MNILIKLKNNAKSDYTIRFIDKALTYLDKYTDLENPESVKTFIANLETSNSYKHNLCLAYDKYAQYYKIEWEKPFYKRTSKQIRIPTTERLEMLIARASPTLSLMLTISKETGLRPIELCNLSVNDFDKDQRTIYPTTAKYGASRTLRMSQSLTDTLQSHIDKNHLKPENRLFKSTPDNYGKNYRQMRNRLAKKLNKHELKTIRLYDFRHYFATKLYAKTKDILLVKQQMGHKKLDTTLIYTQLLNYNNDEWACRTASTVKQSTELIEAGFEYVTEQDGLKLFRKRK